ncbi:MAG TPA: SRPBCC family protein [Candidatus Dormibacteraeota bacterium]|nr:SRPBCC family protein [Candidatus Dormibacteraeota bacterium]
MEITNTARVEAPLTKVWEVLRDIPRTARCLPGVTLKEQIDANTYAADATVKVGPVQLTYRATLRVEAIDEAAHAAVMSVEATDTKGRGNAAATVRTSAAADGDATAITVVADARIAGVLAQFGGPMIQSVAGRLLGQFAANVRDEVARGTGAA